MILWIIGLSGSGKTTVGKIVYNKLKKKNKNIVFLDGDELRKIWGNDLGHKLSSRKENAKRILRLCKLLNEQKINVICSILSIFPEYQRKARRSFKKYYQVQLAAPINILAKRDKNKVYKKFFKKKIKNVVGLDIKFPKPSKSDLVLESYGKNTPQVLAKKIISLINIK